MPREEPSPRKSGRPAPYAAGHPHRPTQKMKVHEEIADLEKFYSNKRKPSDLEMMDIAEATSLPEKVVSMWFAKRRGEEAGMRLCSLDSITRKKNNRISVYLFVEDFGDQKVIDEAELEAASFRERLMAKGKYSDVTVTLFTSPEAKAGQETADQPAALLAAQIDGLKLGPVVRRGNAAGDTEMKES